MKMVFMQNYQQPPTKRRKLSTRNELFTNYLDKCQYENIYKCLHQNLNIESLIAKEIAQFATGQCKKCENYKNCKNDIMTLYQHHSVYGTMDNSSLEYNRYIDENNNRKEYCFVIHVQIICNIVIKRYLSKSQ